MKTPRALSRLVTGLVAGGLLLSGCSVYDAPLPGGPDTGDSPIEVTARFRDVLDLVPQSTVKIDDVSVGKVTAVKLKGYVAEVTLRLPKDVALPDNARAQIRQTSLLGEKFVSLAPPEDPSDARLSNGDVIGLDRTGRNPEIEEVFSALALLLNGGGVGQLKTIVSELNNTFEGREDEIRSVLTQLRSFTGQLDERRADIVAAIENTNRLAAAARKQSGTIENALDDIPGALRSLNRQRDDLVKLLKALNRLSDVGVRVIRASKESTINTLRDLGPVLDNLAAAGENLPKSFQVFLTYPFIDEAVGRSPVVANSIKMGDYTNLSVDLDLDLADLPALPGLPDAVCDTLGQVQRETVRRSREAAARVVRPLKQAGAPAAVTDAIEDELVTALVDRFLGQAKRQCEAPDLGALVGFGRGELEDVIEDLPQRLRDLLNAVPGIGDVVGDVVGGVLGGATGGGTTSGSGGGGAGEGSSGLGGVLGNRPAPFQVEDDRQIDPFGLARHGFDPGVGTLLLQGVATQR
ncbi:MCE family protein [Nocardioides aurantiacus]|uniref:Phospholipid/cholesterol/gamma-HCH transport system substrate-binding protein n=1 Tax=Nocardioides aurantiacus TaxID=86796 RepID=A0A3N2CQA5_9ACTN|nr:MCE family protein [Nocardioides aurantiacus]ROR89588.1 phospholipid/cholesterol/gamma-HCH transport system substrate-binding protein [Nocardioides aurantiacus]